MRPDRRGLPADPTEEEVTLLELVNRTIDRGVVLHGDAVIRVADVDLVSLSLELVLRAVDGEGAAEDDPTGELGDASTVRPAGEGD